MNHDRLSSRLEYQEPSTPLSREACIQRYVRRFQRLLGAMALVWLGCEIVALNGISRSPLVIALGLVVYKPFLALNGACVLYLFSSPRGRELGALTILSATLITLMLVVAAMAKLNLDPLNVFWQAVGLTSLGLLILRTRASSGAGGREDLAILLPALLQMGLMSLAIFFLLLSITLCPTTYDGLVYTADESLGVQLSFLTGRLFEAVPALALVAGVVYHLLPAATSFVYGMHLRENRLPVRDVFSTSLYMAVLGFPLYLVFPVVGPVFAFETAFPDSPPPSNQLSTVLRVPDQPRNCMPSLHTAWAFAVWWHSRGLRLWARAFAASFLGLTLLATLGLGLHYAIDLVVAFPFAVAVQALCTSPSRARWWRPWVAVCGGILTAVWLLVLRYGVASLAVSHGVTWGWVLLTVLGSLWLERTLHHSTEWQCGMVS